ncbi:recombination regulator RecX [Streptococcus saliviloxodontae]|uniref:Regulatory protein RecX n=1 Tax=Streptococcus saliviloxodontae TaxID=1349416 RepID=A0ABS2PJI7_9STRE|nr:recombination regulator RecX [Streptococcus saliviloxodontae]MBM7635587.1 regulatory protein [Streptococcus saliviloxodontae]
MKITKIEKKKRLYLLEIDDTEKLYVTEDTIVAFFLSKGMTIDQQTLEEIKQFAQLSYGKNLALYYISFKQRTEKEVRDYLIQHDIDKRICPQVIKTLKSEKWIDDRKYVQSFIQQNQLTGDKGPHVLSQKLFQKGIDKDLVQQELRNSDFDDIIQKQAQKLLKGYHTKLNQRALKDKIVQGLITKGFDFNDAKIACDNLDIQTNDDKEQELLQKELDKYYRKLSRKYEGYDLKQRLLQSLVRKGFDYSEIQTNLREYF